MLQSPQQGLRGGWHASVVDDVVEQRGDQIECRELGRRHLRVGHPRTQCVAVTLARHTGVGRHADPVRERHRVLQQGLGARQSARVAIAGFGAPDGERLASEHVRHLGRVNQGFGGMLHAGFAPGCGRR